MSELSSSQASNTNGLKTYEWGDITWVIYRLAARSFDTSPTSDDLGRLFFTVQASVLPCVHCRKSYVDFLTLPHLSLSDPQTKGRTWSQFVHMLHNAVNLKLNKPMISSIDFEKMQMKDEARVRPRAPLNCNYGAQCGKQDWPLSDCFWFWLETVVMDYPIRRREDVSPRDHAKRQADYVKLMYSMPSVLNKIQPELSRSWNIAWNKHPLSARDLQSRTSLARWLFDMETAAGYRSGDFSKFIESLWPLRASTCAPGTLAEETVIPGQCL